MKQHVAIVLAGAAGLLAAGESTWAALAQSSTDPNPLLSSVVDDGVINPGEYAAVYSNGGGGGFGGTLGAGAIHMDADALNLYIGFVPGNALNDIVALELSTAPGGFSDADMDDQADGGRRAVSNLASGDVMRSPFFRSSASFIAQLRHRRVPAQRRKHAGPP